MKYTSDQKASKNANYKALESPVLLSVMCDQGTLSFALALWLLV